MCTKCWQITLWFSQFCPVHQTTSTEESPKGLARAGALTCLQSSVGHMTKHCCAGMTRCPRKGIQAQIQCVGICGTLQTAEFPSASGVL